MTWGHVGHGGQGQRAVGEVGRGRPGEGRDSYHDVVMSEQLQLGQVHRHCGRAQNGGRGGSLKVVGGEGNRGGDRAGRQFQDYGMNRRKDNWRGGEGTEERDEDIVMKTRGPGTWCQ